MGRAEGAGRHRRPSCRHRRGPAAVGRHRRTHAVPDRQTAVRQVVRTVEHLLAHRHLRCHEYERKRPTKNIRSLLVLVLRWSRIGTTDVSPTTAPKNFVSEFVKARSGAFALDGAPSNPSLSTIPADRHSDSATFRENPLYSAMPRTLRTRFDWPVHFSSTFSYSERTLIVNRGGDGRDVGALCGVP